MPSPSDFASQRGDRGARRIASAQPWRQPTLDPDQQLVIISNRGPRDFVWEKSRWVIRNASGGLVSMLTPLARLPNVVWYCCVSEPPDADRLHLGLFSTAPEQADSRLHVVPIPLPADLYHAYYGQISNEILWMLQHHVIGAHGFNYLDAARHRAWEHGYLEANRRLAERVSQLCTAPLAFLLQDYHFYPLPALLRASFPDTPILHFTHIPFPEPGLFKLLPKSWRGEILRGLLGADVVGLQTEADVRSFRTCCEDLFGSESCISVDRVRAPDGRQVALRAYPASVDPASLNRTMRASAVSAARTRLSESPFDQTIIRVDRLDPSKNQVVGFLAFARLLEVRPDLRGRVQFLAFLVPSRTDLGIYRDYTDLVYDTINRINLRWGKRGEPQPIEVFYTNDREQALAAMELCDALLVNSLRDGMNLVAKEWVMVSKRPGAMIVSETAGVAEDAAVGALLVCPSDVEGTAQAMAQGLDMTREERQQRLDALRQRIERWTARDWLWAQLADLGLGGSPAFSRLRPRSSTAKHGQ